MVIALSQLPRAFEPITGCRLLEMPAELLLDILSYLSYLDLQRVRQVCKSLKNVIADSAFDAALFCLVVLLPISLGTDIVIHPFLRLIDGLVFRPSQIDFLLPSPSSSSSSKQPQNALAYPIPLAESATSQPSSSLLLDLQYGHVHLTSPALDRGVTVKQVLEALSDFWTQKTDPAGSIMSNISKQSWSMWGVMRSCRIGSRARWMGWKKVWVRVDGVVVMEAKIGSL
ncbi:hypothetical protein JCM11641_004010 [Rhodosporidiobolus odoratus]